MLGCAEVVWSGPGVCLWRVRPVEGFDRHYTDGCGVPSGVYLTGVDAQAGDVFELRLGTGEVLASATLPEAPRYVSILPIVVAP